MANLRVKLYRALKSDGWRQRPVKSKEIPNLKDLPDGEGKFYLSYQQDGRRKMQPVNRFADAAKTALVRKEAELVSKARNTDIALPAEPAPRKTLWTLRDEFIEDKKTTFKRDGTPLDADTIKSYENVTKEFLEIIGRQYPEQIATKDLKVWMMRLRNGYGDREAISHNTVCNYYILAVAYLHFCGVDHKKRLKQSERPTPTEEVPEEYTQAEMEKFFFAITDERDSLAFELFFKSGPREQELANLQVMHLDLDATEPVVKYFSCENFRTKTGKSRSIPLEKSLVSRLKAWVEGKTGNDLVFRAKNGGVEGHFLRYCLRYAKLSGQDPKRFWLHKFRDTFATWALRRGVDIRTVSAWLGHTSIEMTMKYLAPAKGKVAQTAINQAFGSFKIGTQEEAQ
jgi:integrase/recombinase XerD